MQNEDSVLTTQRIRVKGNCLSLGELSSSQHVYLFSSILKNFKQCKEDIFFYDCILHGFLKIISELRSGLIKESTDSTIFCFESSTCTVFEWLSSLFILPIVLVKRFLLPLFFSFYKLHVHNSEYWL